MINLFLHVLLFIIISLFAITFKKHDGLKDIFPYSHFTLASQNTQSLRHVHVCRGGSTRRLAEGPPHQIPHQPHLALTLFQLN